MIVFIRLKEKISLLLTHAWYAIYPSILQDFQVRLFVQHVSNSDKKTDLSAEIINFQIRKYQGF